MSTMTSPFLTPVALVQGLHDGDHNARSQFQDWLRDPVQRLMTDLRERHRLSHDPQRLTYHALHSAETYLRARPVARFSQVSMRSLRATVLLYLAKQAHQPFGGELGNGFVPAPLPTSEQYLFRTVFLPYEQVGSFWYGGDWYGGIQTQDGTLWITVADVTGHGYYAYLLASTLPDVWKSCWDQSTIPKDPHTVLMRMHSLLLNCLPEGIFVECTLLRLEPNGKVIIAPAGASRLLVRRCGQPSLELLKLRGLWLGLDAPLKEDQRVVLLEKGDELMVASDGVFDQLVTHFGSDRLVLAALERSLEDGYLLSTLEKVLNDALKDDTQKDDITIVMVSRDS